MIPFASTFRWLAVGLLSCSPGLRGGADEGMWLFTNPPRQVLKVRHGFEPTDAWLDHLRLASVKFGNGGSAEFVSEEGLILSNHHVGRGAVQRLSTPEHNYLREGFYARTRADEKSCSGLELRVLISMEDVTAQVKAAVKPGMGDAESFAARRAVIARIEKESLDQTGLRSEVITLYQGAEYHIYRYKTYTDIRLVFAPEEQIAFFGGDPDNFEYPRYDLDICFFRAYENGQPVKAGTFSQMEPRGGSGKRAGICVRASGPDGPIAHAGGAGVSARRRVSTLPAAAEAVGSTCCMPTARGARRIPVAPGRTSAVWRTGERSAMARWPA